MFTGIIQSLGTITQLSPQGNDLTIEVYSEDFDFSRKEIGESIAVNGVCLTATAFGSHSFCADISVETLDLTTLNSLNIGQKVNLERALTPQSLLGGHLVSGHIDGIGTLIEKHSDARSERLTFEAPLELAKYIAHKGSMTIDGTSLTVNEVKGAQFSVNIVPHTQEKTIMQYYEIGQLVNLEVDLIARYLERLINSDPILLAEASLSPLNEQLSSLSEEKLKSLGY